MEVKNKASIFSLTGSVTVNKPKDFETLIVVAFLTGKTSGIITINKNGERE